MPCDSRVDAYIAAAAPFAQPILARLREVVHAAAPLDKAIKWSMPMFLHDGRIVANMAAFTAHAAFGTWGREGGKAAPNAHSRLGKLTGLADLPPDAEIAAMVRAAIAQVDDGGSLRAKSMPKPPPEVSDDLRAALAAAPAAATFFIGFPPGAQREYANWIAEAKTAATRAKRIARTVEWSTEGKRRNWKYESC